MVITSYHACDNPGCVNPAHLSAGPLVANSRDMVAKGRSRTAKLTWERVAEIRARYAAGGVTQAALATEYGVAEESVSNVVRRVTWADDGPTAQAA